MKHKTNEQKMRSLLKNLHTFEVAILVERIEKIMDLTLESIEEDPTTWNSFFVSPNVYISLAKKVKEEFK